MSAPFFGSLEDGMVAVAGDYGLGIQLSQNNVKIFSLKQVSLMYFKMLHIPWFILKMITKMSIFFEFLLG